MKESDYVVMEEFLDDIKVVINTLGYKVLEPLVQHGISSTSDDENLLYILTGAAKATGKTTTEGFVLFQGAVINEKVHEKSVNVGIVKLRKKRTREKNQRSGDDRRFTLFKFLSCSRFCTWL